MTDHFVKYILYHLRLRRIHKNTAIFYQDRITCSQIDMVNDIKNYDYPFRRYFDNCFCERDMSEIKYRLQ